MRRGCGRKLLDRPGREHGEILDGALESGERRAARLVGDRDGDLGAGGERLEQRPLGRGEILEAVREDRLAVPRLEIALEPLCRSPAQAVAVPEPEPVELSAVGASEPREIAPRAIGVDERRLELAERLEQDVREPARPRGRGETVELRLGDGAADRERALCVARDPSLLGKPCGDVLEKIVERPDSPAHERGPPTQQIALDALDVRPVRHDEPRLAVELREIALEEQRDLAGVRRPDDEREAHAPIVVPPPDASPYCAGLERAKSVKSGGTAKAATALRSTRLPTSACGPSARPAGRASFRRSRRTDLPASSRVARRCS